jgi:hypothetical protein
LQLENSDNNPATALRTFNPMYKGAEIFSYERGKSFDGDFITVEWSINPLGRDSHLYDELFQMQLFNKNNSILPININKHFEGGILIADIDSVISDGISEYETSGFIDYYDCPPIDTWFYMSTYNNRRILFSWIPKSFVSLVQNGCDVNMIATFLWYEDWVLREGEDSIEFKH